MLVVTTELTVYGENSLVGKLWYYMVSQIPAKQTFIHVVLRVFCSVSNLVYGVRAVNADVTFMLQEFEGTYSRRGILKS